MERHNFCTSVSKQTEKKMHIRKHLPIGNDDGDITREWFILY